MDNFYISLNDGTKMPRLGLGTWKSPPEQTKQAIITAVKAGYRSVTRQSSLTSLNCVQSSRLIDCANDYDNEHVIGEALQELFAEGVVKREDLFIQAKLWNGNHRTEHVKPDILKTLEDLQLDYIDSFVIHWPQAVPSTGSSHLTPYTLHLTPHTLHLTPHTLHLTPHCPLLHLLQIVSRQKPDPETKRLLPCQPQEGHHVPAH